EWATACGPYDIALVDRRTRAPISNAGPCGIGEPYRSTIGATTPRRRASPFARLEYMLRAAMLPRPIRHRRGRRTDFVEIAGILAASEVPAPVPDRATLRRFRRIVSDLGADFYVALLDERLVGFVHVTYARQLAEAPRARVEALVVAPGAR